MCSLHPSVFENISTLCKWAGSQTLNSISLSSGSFCLVYDLSLYITYILLFLLWHIRYWLSLTIICAWLSLTNCSPMFWPKVVVVFLIRDVDISCASWLFSLPSVMATGLSLIAYGPPSTFPYMINFICNCLTF